MRRSPARRRSEPAAAPAAAKVRLSFKQRHALEKLPGEIEGLRARIASLGAALADPQLYARDRDAFTRTSAELAAAEASLAKAEEEWLELEAMREALG